MKNIHKKFSNLLVLSIASTIAFGVSNSWGATYQCIDQLRCDITTTGTTNYIALNGTLGVVNINASTDNYSYYGNNIYVGGPTTINTLTYTDITKNANYVLHPYYDDLLVINNLDANGLTIDLSYAGLSAPLNVSFHRAIFSNALFADYTIVKIQENNSWVITEQKGEDLSNTTLDLSNPNIKMNITFDNQEDSGNTYSFIFANEIMLGMNTSLKLTNLNNADVRLFSANNQVLYADNITISYQENSQGNVYLQTNNINVDTLSIYNGNLMITENNTKISATRLYVDNMAVDFDTITFYNIQGDSYVNHFTNTGNTTINIDGFSGSAIKFGQAKDGWDHNTIETDENYAIYIDKINIKNWTYLDFEGYINVNEINTNESVLVLTLNNSYLHIVNQKEVLNLNVLDMTNSKFEVNTDAEVSIVGAFKLLGDSQFIGGNLTIQNSGSNTRMIELGEFHQDNYAIDVISIQASSTLGVSVDSSALLNVGETYTFKFIQANIIYGEIDVSFLYQPTWIDYGVVEDGSNIDIQATRTQSYSDVLTTSNTSTNDFTSSLATAIDFEMSDGEVSQDLARLIYNLDSMSGDAQGLAQNLNSLKSVNRSYYINSLSKNDSNVMSLMQGNTNNDDSIWIDYNYGYGNSYGNYNDDAMTLAMGHNVKLNDNNKLGLSIGVSELGLKSDNADSTIKVVSIGLIYGYENQTFYGNLGVLNSLNESNTDRYDTMGGRYSSSNNYNDIMIGGLIGKDITFGNIKLINSLYASYNYIKMDGYSESGSVGYDYNSEKYSSIESGYTIGIKSAKEEGINWEAKSDFGYKQNKGGSDVVQLRLDNSQLIVEDSKVDNKGFIMKPKLGISYSTNKVSIEGMYEFEYMKDNYNDNKFKVVVKYKTS